MLGQLSVTWVAMGLLADLGIKFYIGKVYRWASTWCTWCIEPQGYSSSTTSFPGSLSFPPTPPRLLQKARDLGCEVGPLWMLIEFLFYCLGGSIFSICSMNKHTPHYEETTTQAILVWKIIVLAIYRKIWLEMKANSDGKFH